MLLLTFGIYFTLKTRFFMPKSLKSIYKTTLGSLKSEKQKNGEGISSFQAVATALGGTVGVGSIVGVGYGIAVGGAGSIFWMWVCSFFGMGLKYSEIKIASGKKGNTPQRLEEKGFKKLAVIFSFFCVAASFGTGNLTQVGSINSFLSSVGLEKNAVGAICVGMIGLAVFGGGKRIAAVNSFLMPLSSAFYIFVCLAILIINFPLLPSAFGRIFSEAFGFSAITGGFSAVLLGRVIREGFARSLFSNEAGMGSSPLAYATVENNDNEGQGEWGIFEIFFDSFVVSTLTALCLLSCNTNDPAFMFKTNFGSLGTLMFGAFAAVFAFASVISWCYYGECALSYLFPKKELPKLVYRVVFSVAAIFGVVLSGEVIWQLADILNGMMLFPNLFLLFICRKEIERMK